MPVQVLPMVLPWGGLVLPDSGIGGEAGLAAGAASSLLCSVILNSVRPSWKSKDSPGCYGGD